MLVTLNKNVNNVDFGVGGKKSLKVEFTLNNSKDNEWVLSCYYLYIINPNGTLTPVDKSIVGTEWLTKAVNETLEELKTLQIWKFA